MAFWITSRALWWRNAIYRKRRPIGSLLDFMLPIIGMALLLWLKSSADSTDSLKATYRDAKIRGNDDVIRPLTFGDWLLALKVSRTCFAPGIPSFVMEQDLLGKEWFINELEDFYITGNQYGSANPLVRCDPSRCEESGENATKYCEVRRVGLVNTPSNFRSYVEGRYGTELLDYNQVFHEFTSNDDLNDYVTGTNYESQVKIAVAVMFDETFGFEDGYKYTLRVNSTNFNNPEESARPVSQTTPWTSVITADYYKDDDECVFGDAGGAPMIGPLGESCTGKYIYNGAITLQRLVNDFIIFDGTDGDINYQVAEGGVGYVPFPSIPYIEEGFFGSIGPYVPLILVLLMLYQVSNMIRFLVTEKEQRQVELLKIMSVSQFQLEFTWITSFLAFHIPSAIICGILSTLFWEKADSSTLIFFWVLLVTCNILFCTAIGAISSKATRGTLVGLLSYFIGYILIFQVDVQSSSVGMIGGFCLHPVTAFSIGFVLLGDYEDKGFDITSDLNYPNGLTFHNVIGYLIQDIIVWSLITWYMNRVVKGDFGRANPLHFFFLPSYWCPGRFRRQTVVDDFMDEVSSNGNAHIENVPDTLKEQEKESKCVSIKNLRMTFKNIDGSEKVAVDRLNLNIYSGQVTALLGHNGAGKTTTINMLTGLLEPTSGDAKVMGKSIVHDMPTIRQNIGICLQHDCLFDLLNVQEHIEFYSMLKNSYDKENVIQVMKDVALLEKRYTASSKLSGGMKRKLSVAIAFCGDSKTVFLDEPTSGMDPYSRRFTWDVIRQYKQNRCIILTTHFMDEADLLGDRIAILADGQLRCVGSSLFLKKEYGVGYQLILEKANLTSSERTNVENKAISLVKGHVEDSSLLSNVGTELSFQIPLSASPKFPSMLREIENLIENDEGLINYGVSITTLEEVFLIIARGDDSDKLAARAGGVVCLTQTPNSGQSEENDEYEVPVKIDDGVAMSENNSSQHSESARKLGEIVFEPSYQKHVTSLVRKRALNFKRDKKAWFCSVMLPAVISLFGFISLKFAPDYRNLDNLVLLYEDLNPDVRSNQNPLVFNAPNSTFQCNPGKCVNLANWNDTLSKENYRVCGIGEDLESCSISRTSLIFDSSPYSNPAVPVFASFVEETSSYLNATSNDSLSSRYGAVFFTRELQSRYNSTDEVYSAQDVCLADESYTNLRNASLQCSSVNGLGYLVAYNFTGIHSSLLYTAIADESILRSASSSFANKVSPSIKVTLDPLPITAFEAEYAEGEDAFFTWFTLVFAFPFITGSFAIFVVAERKSKARHLQAVAGVSPSAYWVSSYIWDIINFQLPCWVIFFLMAILGINVYTTTTDNILSATIFSLMLFGPSAAGFTYINTFFFKDPSTCQFFVIIFNFFIGMGGPLASFILRILNASDEDSDFYLNIARITEWCLRINPSFCLGHALFFIINIPFIGFTSSRAGEVDAWDSDVVLYDVIVMAIQSMIYPIIAIYIDKASSNPSIVQKWKSFIHLVSFKWLKQYFSRSGPETQIYASDDAEIDGDIKAEEERVLSQDKSEEAIVLKNLVKQWNPQKIAVNKLTLGIPAGECFGLLGINGAGKTTTLGMLTAEFPPTEGDAWLNGYSVTHEPDLIRRSIGYCPQFDAHFMNMTGREHVELYANIKGVPSDQLSYLCSAKLKEVGLSEEDADKLSAGYSGGMKRKLSVACASIGEPRIVFLDEPSTGMDPLARRDLWKTILGMVKGGSTSVVLTTHSMEECEALCPRIGIMAGGRLKCLGSAQHLKSRYGKGYQVELTIQTHKFDDEDYLKNLKLILESCGVTNGDIEALPAITEIAERTFLDFEKTKLSVEAITGDNSLSSMLTSTDPYGYVIFKDASSFTGVSAVSLASFVTNEIRVKRIITHMSNSYEDSILRERQESKCRFEVGSDGIKISSIFEMIEEQKDSLKLEDYGISQTSLEQVFNIHAEIAEQEKQGLVEY